MYVIKMTPETLPHLRESIDSFLRECDDKHYQRDSMYAEIEFPTFSEKDIELLKIIARCTHIPTDEELSRRIAVNLSVKTGSGSVYSRNLSYDTEIDGFPTREAMKEGILEMLAQYSIPVNN